MQLQRSVSNLSLLLFAVGGIVGSGWLFGPFFAAQIAGPAAILAWVVGGVLMMFVALTFAELAAMFPLAGGSIRFLQLSHGTLVGFTFAWVGWISSVAVAPIETMALLQYSSHYVPWLMYSDQGVHLLTAGGAMVAALLMAVMCFINVAGAGWLSKSNNIIVAFKLLIPLVTAVILLSSDFHLSNFSLHGFAPMGWHSILATLPSAGIIFSFIGYSPAIQMAGEAKHPQVAIPLAIIGALSICIVLYFVLQLSFIGAVSESSLSNGWSKLHFAGDVGPFVGIMSMLGLAWFVKVLYLDAFVSPFGTALIYTGSTARMGYAMGSNGYMPKALLKLSSRGVPARMILVNYLLGLLLFLPFPTWQQMMGFLVSALVFAYAVGPLALIVLRHKVPDQHRPFRLPAAPVMAFIAFYVCNLILLWTGWAILSKMLITVGVGYLVLFIYQLLAGKNRLVLHGDQAMWLLAYLIMIGLVSYLGGFGGGAGLIPFGLDFAFVALLSLVIYVWAFRAGIKVKALL
jgi:amino acid transporter